MSQIAFVEIIENKNDFSSLSGKTLDGNVYFYDNEFECSFFDKKNKYIGIINDLETRELDMLIFDYKIDLSDFKKMYDIISPLFNLIKYFVTLNISLDSIRLYISEDCNITYDEFIQIPIEYSNMEKSFIKYLSENHIISTNCFPPIVFSFF